jgi:phosphoenolpyruvate carboxylase
MRPQALGVLSKGLIAPVITAHPSEVRRKSVLDRQNAIAAISTQWTEPCPHGTRAR